jgi:RimJ/RimL family protein N-acetyltransferase
VSGVPYPATERPLPDMETERLVLRRFRAGDERRLAPVFAKSEVWRFPFGRGFSASETREFVDGQLAEWDERGFGLWLAIERATSATLGFVGLSVPWFLPEILPAVEVGWRLDPSSWGRGLATEGAEAALREAFMTLGLAEVCSVPQADNPRSVRVAERLAMRFVRPVVLAPTERRGQVEASLFAITRGEWARSRGADQARPGESGGPQGER